MENTEAIWQQRLAQRREGITWKTIIEAEGFAYNGTFTGQLKKARQRGWIPPEESLPPAIRRDGKRQGLLVPKQETSMPTDVVEVLPGQMDLDADTPPEDAVSATADISAVAEISVPLSLAETQTLEHYEAIITQGFKTFVDVGHALLAIREQRLYRQDYTTFEEYLQQRWELGQSRAYQLMDAAGVVTNLQSSTIVELPSNEAQTRPLTTLPPEQQAKVWQEAVETAPAGKVTAAHVKKTVNRMKNGTTAPKIAKPKAQEPPAHRPPRQRVQDGLFGVLAMVKDDDAWTILGELALALDTYAEEHEDPNLMQRMEQALSPLWHLIEDHKPGQADDDA